MKYLHSLPFKGLLPVLLSLHLVLSFSLSAGPAQAQDDTIPMPSPSAEPDTTPSAPPIDEKNPWIAAGFSLLLPGTGQMYVEERIWPEILITAGLALAVVAFVVVDQQRAASIKLRPTKTQGEQRLADAHWDALTLLLQIGVPSLWLWNAGDAYRRAERFEQNVIPDLERESNAYIIEENLVSVTLWQF